MYILVHYPYICRNNNVNNAISMKKILSLIAIVLAMVGCTSQNKNEEKMKKKLVIYYSQTGATKQVAQEFAKRLDADTLGIEVQQPYNGTYEETIDRCLKEMNANELPKLRDANLDLSKYDTIFLGYPIWFGTYARPIAALVKEVDFTGKKIIPFCTFGSGGLGASMKDLKAALPQTEICQGYGVRNARIAKAPAEVERFLIENGYIAGEVVKLPDYSEQQSVTPEEIDIFQAACGDYKYPIGTPVTVGKRATSAGIDYRYTVNSKDAQGNDTEAVVFITVSNDADAKPEFTEVVR